MRHGSGRGCASAWQAEGLPHQTTCPTTVTEPAGGAEAVFLHPGEMFATDTAARVKTIVGSCVAITMRAPRLGFAAIAHCLLPEAGVADGLSPGEAPRFVDTAIGEMLRMFAGHGASPEELEIKLFGGAEAMGGEYSVGRRNVEAARAELAARGLPIAAFAVGGKRGRVLEFDTETGQILLKKLPERRADGQAVPR